MNGQGSAEDEKLFSPIRKIAEELNSTDVLIISAPVWNFSFPYVVKQYIDIAIQPGINFQDESGNSSDSTKNTQSNPYVPVTSNKSLVIVSSSGAAYSESNDFLTPYLIKAFRMVGFDQSHVIQIKDAAYKDAESLLKPAQTQAEHIAHTIRQKLCFDIEEPCSMPESSTRKRYWKVNS